MSTSYPTKEELLHANKIYRKMAYTRLMAGRNKRLAREEKQRKSSQ